MSDPFLAEIRIFPFNFAPTGWAVCNGQLLPISQNTALFSLLGTTYGGDGRTTFALPNLQESVPMHPGQGPGLSLHMLGESGGSDTVSLLESETPVHAHPMSASAQDATVNGPAGQQVANGIGIGMYAAPGTLVGLNQQVVTPAGGSQPHNNLQPYLTLNICIALQGIYPPRT
jgi:microcystin-dependent protein